MSNEQTTPVPPTEPNKSRSEGLLPIDSPDPDLEIAEEVSFDLQSDSTRRVGPLPEDTPVSNPAKAIAQTLNPLSAEASASPQPGQKQVDEAIQCAVAPSA